jgi:hypothetical protein
MNAKDIIQLREKFKNEGQTEGKNRIKDENGNVTTEYVEWLETQLLKPFDPSNIQRRYSIKRIDGGDVIEWIIFDKEKKREIAEAFSKRDAYLIVRTLNKHNKSV